MVRGDGGDWASSSGVVQNATSPDEMRRDDDTGPGGVDFDDGDRRNGLEARVCM